MTLSSRKVATLILAFLFVGCGCQDEPATPFFLKKEPVAPQSAAGVTEESLGVPLFPGAIIDEKATIKRGNRLRLLYRLNELPHTVANFYERRLRAIASKSKGTKGKQYFLLKVLPNGRRTTVIIEPLMKNGLEAGSVVKLLHEKIKPIRPTNASGKGK